VGRSDFKSE